MKYHETIHGERVALAWHLLWALLCLSDVAACVFVFRQAMPMYSAGMTVAWLLWTLAGQSIAAACGAVWHVVAALEHRRVIALRWPRCINCSKRRSEHCNIGGILQWCSNETTNPAYFTAFETKENRV
jgi:hypothetical protein